MNGKRRWTYHEVLPEVAQKTKMNNYQIECIGLVVTVIAIAGVWCNNRKMIWCFYLWLVSNALSAFVHLSADLYSLLARDLIFMCFAVEGLFKWRKPAKGGD